MAESFHRSLDNAASIASILDQSPDMSQYIEEEEEKEEELRTCFFVEAISVDIDDRFANLESGLLRLIYVRKESHDDERTEIPLLGVVPYLNITCIAGSVTCNSRITCHSPPQEVFRVLSGIWSDDLFQPWSNIPWPANGLMTVLKLTYSVLSKLVNNFLPEFLI
jgi:hypothetical protein